MPDEQREPPKPKTTAANKQDRCFECRYRLRGLPERHKCPECGAPYDLRTLVWRPRRRWALFLILAVIVVLFASMLKNAGSLDPATQPVLMICMIGVAVMIVCYGYGLWRRNRRGRYVAVSPQGIRVRTIELNKTWTWNEIDHIQGPHAVVVVTRPYSWPTKITSIFNNEKERLEFCEAANHYVPWYHGHEMRPAATDAGDDETDSSG